ncbi:hypothetical protein [Pedobacter glucosidilyticus]|uniref:hypothetical protein n=1 Tax=Pedobacter glucosidilyticus TaxID=1122941 RepID=UPI0004147FA6|nr:hypothetical protein [Pedobacter glucosidilyticus]
MKNLSLNKLAVYCLTASLCLTNNVFAQISEKQVDKMFAPKGTYRSPFKKASEVALTSVNLRFKVATSEKSVKRDAGSAISWAFLEGVDDALFQEIADEYYQRLAAKLKSKGFNISDKYKESKHYATLLEKNGNNERQTYKKSWGIANVYTANKGPYIEFPVMMGAHTRLANELKYPVGQVFLTIDFAYIAQSISKDTEYGFLSSSSNTVTTKTKATIYPVITVEAVTEGAVMRGDGSYALFAGDNYGFCNAIIKNGQGVVSQAQYAEKIESAKGMPESMKKFKSDVIGDMAAIFSGGLVGNGRATGEFTFNVKANPEKYKAAVLDALEKYNDYLMAYITTNNN